MTYIVSGGALNSTHSLTRDGKPYRNWKPRFFLSEPWRTETEVFWNQVNTVSPSGVCVYIWYKDNELVQARRLMVPSKSSARINFPI